MFRSYVEIITGALIVDKRLLRDKRNGSTSTEWFMMEFNKIFELAN
jgi:hypothetical protein